MQQCRQPKEHLNIKERGSLGGEPNFSPPLNDKGSSTLVLCLFSYAPGGRLGILERAFARTFPQMGQFSWKKMGVRLEPQRGLGGVHSKVQPKTGFFGLFLEQTPQQLWELSDGGGAVLCSTPGSPRNIPVEKNGVHMGATQLLSSPSGQWL